MIWFNPFKFTLFSADYFFIGWNGIPILHPPGSEDINSYRYSKPHSPQALAPALRSKNFFMWTRPFQCRSKFGLVFSVVLMWILVRYWKCSAFANFSSRPEKLERLVEHKKGMNQGWNYWSSVYQKNRVFSAMLFMVPHSIGGFWRKSFSSLVLQVFTKKIRETRKLEHFVERTNEVRKPDRNSNLSRLEFMPRNLPPD